MFGEKDLFQVHMVLQASFWAISTALGSLKLGAGRVQKYPDR